MRFFAATFRVGIGCSIAIACQPSSAVWHAASWQPPTDAEIPADSMGTSIRRGIAILSNTRDSLPAHVGSKLRCLSCHLEGGRRPHAAPLAGVYARFPKFMDRTGDVVSIEDRVNYCFTRSLAGTAIPVGGREMRDIVNYLAFISRGVPIGEHVDGEGMPKMPALVGVTTRGATLYGASCARCHGADGAGIPPAPPLWGPSSYSIGASMARPERAASFVRHNMPLDTPGILTDQEAYDVAAFIDSKPRPDSPGKEHDWPTGGAPADVPYATKGHVPVHPPPIIARRTR